MRIFSYSVKLASKTSVTIVELVVVMAIVAILITLAVPLFERAIEEARIREARSVLNSIRGAQKIFKAEKGYYIGVNIAGAKPEWQTYLNIEVVDDADWSYGASWGCGCSPAGGVGADTDNIAITPYARRERGDATGRFIYIQMSDGLVRGTVDKPRRPEDLITGSICSEVTGNCNLQR